MNPEQSIQPLNIAAATIIVQILFISAITITASLSKKYKKNDGIDTIFSNRYNKSTLIATDESISKTSILIAALSSISILLISEDLYKIWSPIFHGVGINTISTTSVINFTFIINIILTGYLILITGGGQSSPFTSALFTIPALAIFLRLPPKLFIAYAIASGAVYLILLTINSKPIAKNQIAAAAMNISCLLLSIFTGYIARPIPINEIPIINLPTSTAHTSTDLKFESPFQP